MARRLPEETMTPPHRKRHHFGPSFFGFHPQMVRSPDAIYIIRCLHQTQIVVNDSSYMAL
jgi:hypothetical protein